VENAFGEDRKFKRVETQEFGRVFANSLQEDDM
jgi:hypothetical protein